MKRSILGLLTAFTLVLGFAVERANATNILYYVDGNNGTDQMAAALGALGGSYTTTFATSPTDFATQIATNNYALGIFSAQETYGADYTAGFAALSTFVQGGGKAIVNSWFTPAPADISPFGADFTGNINETSATLSAFTGGITNPVLVMNPAPPYATFSTGMSLNALTGTSIAAIFAGDGNAAIITGNNGRSIVNGFLNDTLSASQGVQLYENEINSLLSPQQTSVPLPTTAISGLSILVMLAVAKSGVMRKARRATT